MTNKELKILLALLLIDKVELFRASYQLCKVLAWKFKIIEFVDLTDALIKDGLITSTLIENIEYYKITDNGLIYLLENENRLQKSLNDEYPKEQEFIGNIFSKGNTDSNDGGIPVLS